MIPDSWASLAAFIFGVMPGVFYEHLVERRRSSVRASSFRELGRVVSASVICCVVAVVAVMGLQEIPGAPGVPLSAFVQSSSVGILEDPWPHLITFGALFAIAMLAAFLGSRFVKEGDTRFSRAQPWHLAFTPPRAAEPGDSPVKVSRPVVMVHLTDGRRLEGHANSWTSDIEAPTRDLVLGAPLYRWTGGNRVDMPIRFERIVINESNIRSIFVMYWDTDKFDDELQSQVFRNEVRQGRALPPPPAP